MKVNYDKVRIREGEKAGAYNARGLAISKSGKHLYPSKKMFIDWLKSFPEAEGEAEIWSEENWDTNQVRIWVEVVYDVPDLPPQRAERSNRVRAK